MDDDLDVLIDIPPAVLRRIVDAICACQAGDMPEAERLIDEALFLQAFFADEPDEVRFQA